VSSWIRAERSLKALIQARNLLASIKSLVIRQGIAESDKRKRDQELAYLRELAASLFAQGRTRKAVSNAVRPLMEQRFGQKYKKNSSSSTKLMDVAGAAGR